MKEAPPVLPSALYTQPLQALLWAGTKQGSRQGQGNGVGGMLDVTTQVVK